MTIGLSEPEKMDSAVTVTPTSRRSSMVTPFDLVEKTDSKRVYFKPKIVENPNTPSNRVEGDLVYERKKPTEKFFPTECDEPATTRSSVGSHGALSISLSTSETRALYDGLQRMYSLSGSFDGIPYDRTSFIEASRDLNEALSIVQQNLPTLSMLKDPETANLVKDLLKLLARGLTHKQLARALGDLEEGTLRQLSNGLNLEILERAVEDIESHLNDPDAKEAYWQDDVFCKYPWIISQVFATPCALIQSKAYVGGTIVDGSGASFVDFLYRSELTRDVLLIEIKKPTTKLLSGDSYRSNSYRVSSEMSGALSQVLSYKQTLMTESQSLVAKCSSQFDVVSPRCAIIIGHTNELHDVDGVIDPTKRDTFENFRNCLSGVTVITYDELLQKVKALVRILKAQPPVNAGSRKETGMPLYPSDDEDIPF